MAYDMIILDIEQDIASITLNRPQQMNSLNLQMVREISDALDVCAASQEVRAIVITGIGDVFSSGDDIELLKMAEEMSIKEFIEIIKHQGCPALVRKLMSLPKPIIASVNGICFGAGSELAMACDHIIASNKATFGQLYVSAGLTGNTYLLPRYVGPKKALELLWTGKIISAEEAYQLGMINSVVVSTALVKTTYRIARNFAKGPTLAMGLAKKAVYEGLTLDAEQGLNLMCDIQGQLMMTEDYLEGLSAWLEDRRAHFKGK